MRYLSFSTEDESGEIYATLYGGMVTTTRPFNKAETRIYGRLLTMMEAIGKPIDDLSFELVKSDTLALEDIEFALIVQALDETQWTTRGTRRAARLYDWLDKVPTTRE